MQVLREFKPDVEPKAVCIEGESVTTMGDEQQHVSYLNKENQIVTFSILTGQVTAKSAAKGSGRTVGVASEGERRVGVKEDQSIFMETAGSQEVLFETQEPGKELKGISGAATKMVLWNAHEKQLWVKNLANFDQFGPSIDTCQQWLLAGPMEAVLTRHKEQLARWPLLGQGASWNTRGGSKDALPPAENSKKGSSGRDVSGKARPTAVWSGLMSELIRRKDMAAVKVIADACPVFWAATEYVGPPEGGGSVLDSQSCVFTRKTFFDHALDNNDKILSQVPGAEP